MRYRIQPLAAAIGLAFSAAAWGQAETTLKEVVVQDARERTEGSATRLGGDSLKPQGARTSDVAQMLQDVPGVSFYGAGQVSSLPVIHGLADDRLRVKIDGMDLIAACPNHMNPALSYLDPSQVDTLTVYAGISPVSAGGIRLAAASLLKPRRLNSQPPAPVICSRAKSAASTAATTMRVVPTPAPLLPPKTST